MKTLCLSIAAMTTFAAGACASTGRGDDDRAGAGAAATAASPVATSFDALPREQLAPDILRQALHGDKLTVSRWTLKAGSGVPMHSHANEQATIVLSGRSVAISQGKSYALGPGDIILFPPNVEHEFRITEDAVVLDLFAPRREDWIEAARAAGEP